jgi:hypothetical protein
MPIPVEKAVDAFQFPLPARGLAKGSVEIFCALDDGWNVPRGTFERVLAELFHVEQLVAVGD